VQIPQAKAQWRLVLHLRHDQGMSQKTYGRSLGVLLRANDFENLPHVQEPLATDKWQ